MFLRVSLSGHRSMQGFSKLLLSVVLLCLLVSCATSFNRVAPGPYHSSKYITAKKRLGTSKPYIVERGDTLYSIAFRAGRDYKDVARWNAIAPPYTIFPGQKIILSPAPALAPQPTHKKNNIKIKAQPIKHEENKKTEKKITNSSKKILKFSWGWPLKGKIAKNFSQTGESGIDIAGTLGQPVTAAASGKVVYSGNGLIGYGNLIIVKHNEVFLSAYGRNRKLLVKEGDYVTQGQTIAEVGTIAGEKPSLHFEIRKKGKPVNPMLYLP